MMNNEVIVIIKNKLISVDTVIPILIELKEKYSISSLVLVNDELSHNKINENVVIRDAINYAGKEVYIGWQGSVIIQKIIKLFWLFKLTVRLLVGSKVLHFGIFDVFPYKVLGKIFNKNIFMLQTDCFAHSYAKYNKRLGKKEIKLTPPISKNIVAFNKAMPQLSVLDSSYNVFKFGSTRTREIWVNYVNTRSEDYFNKYHKNVDFSNGCIVFILGAFSTIIEMRIPDKSLTNLFRKTIETLDDIKGDIPVLLKPHPVTDLNVVDSEINEKNGFHITHLHPSVLATKAKVFICNMYSTTMADANYMGVKTVEYSDYNFNLLEMSKGKSLGYEYIDEFINNDQVVFKREVREILSNMPNNQLQSKIPVIDNFDDNSDEFFFQLSKS
jgi:hypothetical protein